MVLLLLLLQIIIFFTNFLHYKSQLKKQSELDWLRARSQKNNCVQFHFQLDWFPLQACANTPTRRCASLNYWWPYSVKNAAPTFLAFIKRTCQLVSRGKKDPSQYRRSYLKLGVDDSNFLTPQCGNLKHRKGEREREKIKDRLCFAINAGTKWPT